MQGVTEQLETAWKDMHDPARAGVPALIAFRRYHRALKKLAAAGNIPSEIPRYSETAAGEFRLTHLLRAADNALRDILTPTRTAEQLRLDILKLHHFIGKANVGWQAVGLTALQVLEFESLLFRRRGAEILVDKNSGVVEQRHIIIDHYYGHHRRVVENAARKNIISKEDASNILSDIENAYQDFTSQAQTLNLNEVVGYFETIRRKEKLSKDQISRAFFIVRDRQFSAIEFEAKTGLSPRVFCSALEKAQRDSDLQDLKEKFQAAVGGKTTHEGLSNRIDVLERIEQELGFLDAGWIDIGQTNDQVEQIKELTNTDLALSYFHQAEAALCIQEDTAPHRARSAFHMATFCLNEAKKTWPQIGIDNTRLKQVETRIPARHDLF